MYGEDHMTLDEAIAASTIGAAAIPNVEDIVRFADGSTFWWLQTRYIKRSVSLPTRILESNDWHPYEGGGPFPADNEKD